MLEAIGWLATAIFSTSYFYRDSATLRRIQAVAACVWIVYGICIHAVPVVIANVIVAVAAVVSMARGRDAGRLGEANVVTTASKEQR